MAGQERRDDRARQEARDILARIGNEVRQARLNHDLSQGTASAAVGKSTSAWSRLERGQVPYLPVVDLVRAAAVVGLDLSVRAYPSGRTLRDRAHLELLERLRSKLGSGAQWRTEVPLPTTQDKRAWDALILLARARVGVEAETRARDSQDLQRRLALKRRDGAVDHLILLLSDTRHNRGFLHTAGQGFLADFPIAGVTALKRLAAAESPGGSSIILL